jgi:CBS domain-containing protein
MPNSRICEETFFFIHVGSICKGPVVTCKPGTSVVDAARIMSDKDISGLVVVDLLGRIAGIFSIRDFRKVIAESGGDLTNIKVKDVMSEQPVTVRRDRYLFEAIFKMAKHKIHRLVVVDQKGDLCGMLTDTDLLSLQTRSPIYLSQEIEGADSIRQLSIINTRILEMVNCATDAGADIRSLVQLITHFNDSFTLRIIELMERDEGISLPKGAAFLALGSEGRGEQTLRTDQDSAMIFVDDLSDHDKIVAERFAFRLSDALEEVGVPKCSANTMASNPEWRHGLSEWKSLVEQWVSLPRGDHMVRFGMFQDFRTLHGDVRLEQELQKYILGAIKRHALFLPYVARNIVSFVPPIGMFGRIKVEKRGENRGKVDLKKAGIFAITSGISLLALEAGIVEGSTWDKLDQLEESGLLSSDFRETVDSAFSYLFHLRLHRQVRSLTAGHEPTNSIDPLVMTDRNRDRLRAALKGVGGFLRFIRDRYQLDSISR